MKVRKALGERFGSEVFFYSITLMPEDDSPQVLKAFGGGCIHYCGNATQHIDNYLQTEGLRGIHNLNLDDLDGAARMRAALAEKKLVYMTADFNVSDDYIDEYYEMLFKKLGTEGLIVAAYIAPAITLAQGQYGAGQRDRQQVGQTIQQAIEKFNRN